MVPRAEKKYFATRAVHDHCRIAADVSFVTPNNLRRLPGVSCIERALHQKIDVTGIAGAIAATFAKGKYGPIGGNRQRRYAERVVPGLPRNKNVALLKAGIRASQNAGKKKRADPWEEFHQRARSLTLPPVDVKPAVSGRTSGLIINFADLCKVPFIAENSRLWERRAMKKLALLVVAGLVGIVLIVAVWVVGSYNGLVGSSQEVDKQWAQVETVYQRRADLIPNLVKTVEGSANFEKSTLVEITQARASVGQAQVNTGNAPTTPEQLEKFQRAQDSLSGALSRLLVVAERYPDLKANRNFLELQAQLEGTENRISVERNKFNEVVQRYNTRVQRFPGAVIAGMFHFSPRPYFKATAGAETAPKVEFNFGNQNQKAAPAK